MSVLPIVRLGHPALRQPAAAVPPGMLGSPELRELVADMLETMRAADGAGLAAPQVGLELQLFVYELPPGAARVIVNPVLVPEPGDLVEDWEACLSIPHLRGLVPRHPALRVRALGVDGEPLDFGVEGLEARVVQHEDDHLHGIVYLDRMPDLLSLRYDTRRRSRRRASAEPAVAAAG